MAQQGEIEQFPFGENFKICMGIIQNAFTVLKDYGITDESVFAALIFGTSVTLCTTQEQSNIIKNLKVYFKAIGVNVDMSVVRAMITYSTDNREAINKELTAKLDEIVEHENVVVFHPTLEKK